jgi:hypothetical protein
MMPERLISPQPRRLVHVRFDWGLNEATIIEEEYIVQPDRRTIIHNRPSVIRPNLHKNFDIILSQCDTLNLTELECSICYNKIEQQSLVQLNCNHQFCVDCICSYFEASSTIPSCALCRENISNINVTNKTVYDSLSNYCQTK